MSPSIERALRVAGVVALLAVQGACGAVAGRLYWSTDAGPGASRNVRHAAALDAVRTHRPVAFPSVLGHVDRFVDGGMLVTTPEVRILVRFDDRTVLQTNDPEAALQAGAGVLVFGDRRADGSVLADVIVVGRPL